MIKKIIFLTWIVLAYNLCYCQLNTVSLKDCNTSLSNALKQKDKKNEDYEDNLNTLESCLEVFEIEKEWLNYVRAANKLSAYFYYEKNFILAKETSLKAYEYGKKYLGSNHSETGDAVHNLAYFTSKKKQFIDALNFYEESLSNNISLELKDKAATYNGIGDIYKTIGEYERSYQYFLKAVELTKNTTDFNRPAFQLGMSRVLKLQKKNTTAIKQYERCLELGRQIAREYDDNLSYYFKQVEYMSYIDLADIYIELNDTSKAIDNSNKALKILKDNNDYFEAYKQFEIPAKIDFHSGNYQQAIAKYQQAEKSLIEQYEGFEKGKELAQIIAQTGDCYIETGKPGNALSEFQRALHTLTYNFVNKDIYTNPTASHFFNKRSAIEILYKKAKAFNALYKVNQTKKDLLASLETYELIAELIPVTRRDYVEENSKFQLADETQNIFESAIEVCYQLFELTGKQSYLKQAFVFAESSKAVVLQEAMQSNEAVKGLHDSLQIRDLKYRSEIAFYENLIGTTANKNANSENLKRWQDGLFDFKEAYQDFKSSLEKENSTYYTFKYATNLAPVEKIQDALNEEMALIEYFVGHKHIYVFHIEKENFTFTKSVQSKQLEQDIECLEQYLIHKPDNFTFKNDFESFVYTSNSIFEGILGTTFKNLSKVVKHLIIIPDNYLYNISFETLLTTLQQQEKEAFYHPDNLSYLGEDFSTCYGYSASFLLKTLQYNSDNHSNNFIGYAPGFLDLNNNQDEVKKVNAYFNDIVRIGDPANSSNFLKDIKQSKIIHLATHARKSSKNYKLNEIHFSDTILTNYHIENMDITAGLTVLSACETATGLLQSGEGAMSLSRSFFLAGCPSLVSSLWRADDESTADIMFYFYKYLKAGADKDVALQKAKLQYWKDAGMRESHPFYWAGFVQSGNRRALF